ncbi:hypothetical protein [Cellulomonas cellasea]|uniref:Lipoprotein n=1 Tax=Cellulomonas cellasea TaxID=43670 RepID=A0A4Y3KYD2_9CELL|nr:hypothetical protein [Cellulomonas cellasea]GEA87880.1 hypothetical protein CCE01nite_18290 [Cellulomonas cellasea]
MRSSRRLLAVPAAVALLWSLTACSGSTTEASTEPTTKPSATAEATEEAVEITQANFLQTIADAQAEASSYDFTMSTTAEGQAMAATGSVQVEDGGAQALSMVMELPEMGQMEVRMAGGLTYMNLGEMTGGKFLQIDPEDASNPLAAGLGDMTGEIDPTKALAGAEAAVTSVTKKGDAEDVDGVQATPYEVVLDPSKLPEEQRAGLDQAAAAGVAIPTTFVYTYWLDAENLVRKMAFDLMGSKTEMTFSNWGSAAPVTAPSADQITTENPFAG